MHRLAEDPTWVDIREALFDLVDDQLDRLAAPWTTVQTLHNTLHKALSDAVKQGILLINVSERVEAPRKNEYEARVFSEETMDAYSHVLPPMHKEAMGNINEWLIAHTETQGHGKDQVQHEEAEDGQANRGEGHENDDDLGSGMRVLV